MNKKLISSALLAACLVAGAYAQDLDPKALKAAQKELSANIKKAKTEATRAENPDFTAARAAITEAMQSPVAGQNAELYYTAGLVEYNNFNSERNKPQTGGTSDEKTMYNCAKAAYDYFLQAYDYDQTPDAKGKVAAKYSADIVNNMTNLLGSGAFANAAIYYFNVPIEDFAKAYDYFNLFLDSQKLPMFEGNAQAQAVLMQLGSEETTNQIGFYRAYAAMKMKDSQKTIDACLFMKDRGYETDNVYKILSNEYINMGDSAKFEATLIEAAKLLPNEPYYNQTLINYYLGTKSYDKAISYLDNALALDPNNAHYYDLKGRLLETQEQEDAAVECYKKAIELDNLYASPYANLGRILFNRAQTKEDELYSKKRFEEADRVCEPLYLEAMPYLEKGFDLNQDEVDTNTGVGLRQIYYKLMQKPSCPNKAELREKYNAVSERLGMTGIK
jgi:Flp pilus assembly protein TadD